MLKNGDRDLAGSDVDGRVMALEQNTRGLNARVCAIEKSLSADHLVRHNVNKVPQSIATPEITETDPIDDFVPAIKEIRIDQCEYMSDNREKMVGETEKPVTLTGIEKISRSMALPLDITGLLAGALLILISLLLFTGNIGLLKNPLVPLGAGMLLIACVVVRFCLK